MNTEIPQDKDTAICKNCGKKIVFQVTNIDDGWTHVDNFPNGPNGVNGVGFCDVHMDFLTAKRWAEPKEDIYA